jgi:uncharacterized damage-inducible protein DinB
MLAMDKTALIDLYRHMEWADATVWSAALQLAPAASDTRLRELLYHSHLVQHAFLRAWRGEPRDLPFPTFDALPALIVWARDYHRDVAGFVAGVAPERLVAALPLPWADLVEQAIGRPAALSTLADTMQQVPLHTLYHRGQVNLRLREIGGTPPLVDYIAWVWLGRPAAVWPTPIDDGHGRRAV